MTPRKPRDCTTLFLFHKKKTKPLQGLRGRGAEPHSAKRKTKRMFLVKVFTEGKKVVCKSV